MAALKDKIEIALGECRLLILGIQALIGLEYRSFFETGFLKLGSFEQQLKVAGLSLLLVSLILIFSPAPFHQITASGNDSRAVLRFTTKVTELALLPLALALAIDLYVASTGIVSHSSSAIWGAGSLLVTLFFWYGWGFLQNLIRSSKRSSSHMREQSSEKNLKSEPTSLNDKVKNVLLEERMVLPGAQVLLGFQLAVVLLEEFSKLDQFLKNIHLLSLFMIAFSIVLLIAPAAHHRIVEKGEATEEFHTLASRVLLCSMVPLAIGLCGDFFIVVWHVSSPQLAVAGTSLLLILFFGLWLVYPIAHLRTHRKRS